MSYPTTKLLTAPHYRRPSSKQSRKMAATESYIQKLQRAQTHCSRNPQLNVTDYCATNQIAQPQFQDYSDPRGSLLPIQSFVLPHCTQPRLTLILRNKDSLEQQCLRPRSRIPSPPMARLPLSRTISRRCRRSRLEGTQRRPYNERRISGTIQPRLYKFSVMIRSFRRYTMTVLRG